MPLGEPRVPPDACHVILTVTMLQEMDKYYKTSLGKAELIDHVRRLSAKLEKQMRRSNQSKKFFDMDEAYADCLEETVHGICSENYAIC